MMCARDQEIQEIQRSKQTHIREKKLNSPSVCPSGQRSQRESKEVRRVRGEGQGGRAGMDNDDIYTTREGEGGRTVDMMMMVCVACTATA